MRFVELEKCERQSVLVVKISFRLQNAEPRAKQCRQDLFGRGLTHRARDTGNFAAPCVAYFAGELLERDKRVGDDDAASAGRLWNLRELLLRHNGRQSAALQDVRDESESVVTRSVNG